MAANCTIAFGGNHYSTPPGLVGQTVTVRHRLGTLELTVSSAAGVVLASHRLAPPGRRPHPAAGWACRCAGAGRAGRVHQQAALPAQGQPATRPQAQAAARQLRLFPTGDAEVSVDLAHYAEFAGGDQ